MSLVTNKKARLNYEILETLEAGIELLGLEVKSVKKGEVSLEGSYIVVRGGEAFLTGADIAPYQPSNTPKDYDSRRNRKLLLTKKELLELEKKESQKGLTILAISMYNKGRKVKVEIAIARGKKKFDKRQTIKKRESEREIRRTLKTK